MPPPLRAASAFGISYRAKSDEDLPFLERLYGSTREDELAMTGWPEDMKRQFVAQQHFAQQRHHQLACPDMEWLVIERGGAAIGRLYIEDRPAEIRLVDIAFLPESRGLGIGTAVLEDLLAQGRAAGKPVGLSVLKTNRARRLYARLGFTFSEDAGERDRMIWRAEGDEAASVG